MNDPILIVGAGPVGLSLALALTKQGIPVAVFEEADGIVQEIRASTFHAATMEKMDEWGVIDAVLQRGYRVEHLQFWDRRERRIVGDFHYEHIAADTRYPFRLQCPQHVYAETLLSKLRDEPLATLHFGHRFVRCRETPGAVEASFALADGEVTKRGLLLCAADGANSAVRRFLGLGFEGLTYEDRFLLVASNIELNRYYPGIAPVSYIFDPDEWVITLQLTGLLRIVFQVPEGREAEAELQDANIRQRVWRFLGEELDFPILHKSIYRVHQRVADSFRVGRCLLLGDAAHINNPASGMGMNSGILDAACLAEKIQRYWHDGDDQALDAYDAERRAYALQKIKSYTQERYRDMSSRDPAFQLERNQKYLSLSHNPAQAREFLLRSAMLDERI